MSECSTSGVWFQRNVSLRFYVVCCENTFVKEEQEKSEKNKERKKNQQEDQEQNPNLDSNGSKDFEACFPLSG